MSRLSSRAAAACLREIKESLPADEHAVVEAICGLGLGVLTTARALHLSKIEVYALLRSGLDKVAMVLDQREARQARSTGQVH